MIVDSMRVERTLAPGSTAELAAMLRDEAGALAPMGAGKQLDFGNPLGPVSAVVDMRRMDRVTGYVPGDLTVHVEAGVRLGELDRILAGHNQMLALDPWAGPEATIGGIVATNAQGPLRAVGTARDWIIGMTVVHADGRISRTGGRVVKNVSGYDLAKLYTGSLGSLAVIAEISFKLRARYEHTATARLMAPDRRAAFDQVRRIRSGPFDPISLVVAGSGPAAVYVRFGEHPKAVAWQLDHLPDGDWETLEGDQEKEAWAEIQRAYDGLGEIVVRVVARPSELEDIVGRFEPASWLGHAATGILLMSIPEAEIPIIRREFPAILERAPLEVRRRVPTFGLGGAESRLMRRLKTAFDPDGRLNPGRHIDGEAE